MGPYCCILLMAKKCPKGDCVKKKTNPNKIPVSANDYNVAEMEAAATQAMALQVWAVFLAALSGFSETTVDLLLDFFSEVNDSTMTLSTFEETQKWLIQIEEFSGKTLPLKKVNLNIKTQGDLNRLQNCLLENTKAATFAIILDPIIHKRMLDEESIKTVIHKVIAMLEELDDEQISLQDIQDMLVDEYGLLLQTVNNQVTLRQIHDI